MNKAHGKTLIIENNNNNTMINSLINNNNNDDLMDSNGMAIESTTSDQQRDFNSSINLTETYFASKVVDRVVCDICNKQVCNKYFLRTHKAKVHGIYETPYNTKSNNQNNRNNDENEMNNTNNNNNYYDDDYYNDQNDNYEEDDYELEEGEERTNINNNNNNRSSKYAGLDEGEVFVDPHTKKRYINGIQNNKELGEIVSIKKESDENSLTKRRISSCSNNSNLSVNNKTEHKVNGLHSPISSSVYSTPLSPTSSSSFTKSTNQFNLISCDICKKKFSNKYQFRDHMIKSHGANLNAEDDLLDENDEYLNDNLMMENMDHDQDDDEVEEDDDMDYLDSIKNKNNINMKKKQLNKLSTSLPGSAMRANNKFNLNSMNTGRVTCNICNKELCNKYFLRQHVSHRHKLTFNES